MHRTVIALSLFVAACTPSKPAVAPAPSSSGAASCAEEKATAVLYVVDGKPVTCVSAMGLPTERIASVEVLKGPAAAAYGASAGAGVVIIQTKRNR